MKSGTNVHSENPEPWFAVRCLFSHPTRKHDDDVNLYEERITLWKANDVAEAFQLARQETERYAQEANCLFISETDAFHLFDENIAQGSEVWSVMRGSGMEPKDYERTFCSTPRDRAAATE